MFDHDQPASPVTKVNLGGALLRLAKDKVEPMTVELRQLVEREAQYREAAIEGLEAAAEFGSSALIAVLTKYTHDHSIFKEKKQEICREAVLSDSVATASPLLPLLPNPPFWRQSPWQAREGCLGGQDTPA